MKAPRYKVEDLPPRWREEVEALMGKEKSGRPMASPPAKKRLRQDARPILNQLETRFHAKLVGEYGVGRVLSQAVRLELARGLWYKPDFFVPGMPATAYEVKGPKAFRGGFENLKMAARVHGWVRFILVWEVEGKWEEQEVLP